MTLAELYKGLEQHDWFHAMSDSREVYSRGQSEWRRLQYAAETLGVPELFNEYSKHVFSGPAFGTPKHPKPILPGSDSKVRGASELPPLEAGTAIQSNPALPGSTI